MAHAYNRKSPLPPRHYIFNHIPKTGGNSLLAICSRYLDPAEVSPHLTDHEIRLMPAARFERHTLVAGHFSMLTQMSFCRSRYSMTLLRDPIRRIFSAYTFWRNFPEINAVTFQAKQLSFADFVLHFMDSPSLIHNPYIHHFAALGRDCPGYSADSATLLATAKHNLAAFNFVGIAEEFERSAGLLCQQLGWQPVTNVPHENRSSSELSFGDVESRTLEILHERNRLDLELYQYAVQILKSRADNSAKSSCSVELNRFVPAPIALRLGRRATILSVSATWLPGQSSRVLEIAIDFQTTSSLEDLSLGVQVNDAGGKVVWGTSTANERLDLKYRTGQGCQATFLIDCDLPRGTYYATVALSEPRRLGFHEHWIDHATLFTVDHARIAPSRYVRGMRLREFGSTVAGDAGRQ